MSGGEACFAEEHRPRWRVIDRKANHSAFNGGKRTPSAYSAIQCGACGAVWRSKAKFVDALPDAPADWFREEPKERHVSRRTKRMSRE